MTINGPDFFLDHHGELILARDGWDGVDLTEVLRICHGICEHWAYSDQRLFHIHFDSPEEFFEAAKRLEIGDSSRHRKRTLLLERRREFADLRPELEILLIERDGYVCAEPGCSTCLNLTIDHMLPIVKGGSDDLSNLQFLCRFHNSQKGMRT